MYLPAKEMVVPYGVLHASIGSQIEPITVVRLGAVSKRWTISALGEFHPTGVFILRENRPSVRGMEDDIRSLIETLRVEVLPEIDSN